jgi:hypothetical protein
LYLRVLATQPERKRASQMYKLFENSSLANEKWQEMGFIEFLNHLKAHQICFHLEKNLPDSILVEIALLDQKIEIEFTNYGEILIEKFDSTIRGQGEKALEQLLREVNIDNAIGEIIMSKYVH